MEAIRRSSAVLFYLLGLIVLMFIVMLNKGWMSEGMRPYLNTLDLPLLFVAILYGGSSLYLSLSKGEKSMPLALAVFVPLGLLFVFFCWLNFGMGFPEF